MHALAAALALAVAATALPPGAANADPPPWAPAHGWRAKQNKSYRIEEPVYVVQPYPYYVQPQSYGYPVPYGIDSGRCNRDVIGAVVGGVAGGAVGAGVADDDDRTVGIIAGTVVGALLGGLVGDAMDDADYACMGQAFEYARDGRPVTWQDPNGATYRVMPQDTYEDSGRYCRKYTTTALIDGRAETVAGTTCRRPDGSWELVG
ncbi:MAG: glycine zipper domain-containing protein [Dongiaceae bacterium]